MNFLKQAQQEFKVAPKKLLFNTKYISNNVLLLKSQVLLYKSKFFPDKEIERYAREFDKLTGYDLCSQLRIKVIDQDKRYRDMKQQLSQIKERYENEVERRSDNQKELQELLQRKGSWSDTEIIRFAELHREEMKCDTNVKEAKKNLKYMEQVVDEAHQHLMNVMRERYHEEQLWSDKIRRASTYGTLTVMIAQAFLFLISILIIEPRRRRYLKKEIVESFNKQLAELGSIIDEKQNENALLLLDIKENLLQFQDAINKEKLVYDNKIINLENKNLDVHERGSWNLGTAKGLMIGLSVGALLSLLFGNR